MLRLHFTSCPTHVKIRTALNFKQAFDFFGVILKSLLIANAMPQHGKSFNKAQLSFICYFLRVLVIFKFKHLLVPDKIKAQQL